jgi:CubicO group peptidase (beta-lactamase class C family)
MKNTIYIALLMITLLSCKTSKKEIIEKKDYSFITDSLNIDQQLKKHNLAGFSLVVFENYEIIYTNQFGVKSTTSKEKIDKNTAFSTASIAKPIVAILCHLLEEKGLINLDDPIDNYLKRWHLPKSKFTENNNPTWKQFLNHTAGTSQHGFADFYEGDSIPIPTITESLLGQIPRYNKEVEFLFKPSTSWKYSGGGYVIIQMALEDHLNKTLAELANEYIFLPLNLENTTMTQPNENGFLKNVALVHDKNNKVIKTGLPITPQVGPSGLWSNPTDLAKIIIELQNALNNKDNKVISHTIAKKMTTVTALKDAVGGWGYAGQMSFKFNNYDWFLCNGSNTGVGGDILATKSNGNGFIWLANGEKQNRFPIIYPTLTKLLNIMNWEKELTIVEKNVQEIPLNLREKLVGTYNDFLHGVGMSPKILEKNNRLYVESRIFEHFKGKNENELIYLKNGLFKVVDYPNLLKFNFKGGEPTSVILIRDNINTEIEIIRTKK